MYNLGQIQNSANAAQMGQMNLQNAAMLQNLAQLPGILQNSWLGGQTPNQFAQSQLADSMALGQNQFNNSANLWNSVLGRDMNSQYLGAINSFNSQAQNQLGAINGYLSGALYPGVNALTSTATNLGNTANQFYSNTKQGLTAAGNNAMNYLTSNSNAQQQALGQQGYGAAGALEAQGARGQNQLWQQGAGTRNETAQYGNAAYNWGSQDTQQNAALQLAKLYQQSQNMAGGLQYWGNQGLQGNKDFTNEGIQNQQAYGNVAGSNLNQTGRRLQNQFKNDSNVENMKQYAMLSNPALMGQQQDNYWQALQKSMAAQNFGASNITSNSNNVAEQMRRNLAASGINNNAYV